MSITPIITFKAGSCDLDTSVDPPKVIPKPTPGYIYLWEEDELLRFCWRPRSAPMSSPELELVMIPTDGTFIALNKHTESGSKAKAPTNGRIYALKFRSSPQRHLFWLQSKSQSPTGDATWFSPRDLKLGQIVDQLLQGEQVNVREELADVPSGEQGGDEDEAMEDVEGTSGPSEHHRGGSGGAGPDATGGDYREEGQGSREGGADGGRAAPGTQSSTTAAVQSFLQSLQSNPSLPPQPQTPNHFTTLPDLLPPSTTIPILPTLTPSQIDNLLSYLPPTLLLIAQEASDISSVDPTPETAATALQALSSSQKQEILTKVLRSPQFTQSLGSLTMALRDGGLPSISDALGVKVENGGFIRRGGVPLGGGDAVEAFLEGVKASVEEEKKAEGDETETGEPSDRRM